ncbi:hypothetical protein PCL_01574 [Purpureocillium lilacinum]|uniref:NACHT domain-containing protein n=1 Tax=Purpureocillium lilacinum TaxID=33203 RepID=A0A2U3DP05_PURLI|nr:hypothetical protein PCL_01574 [Purpureocillium lilacinum]
MSGIEVVGLISAVISIVGAVENIYSGFRDARNLPRAFCEVAEKLPLVRETLRIAEQQIKSTSDEEACEAIKTIVENCKLKAERLKEIFTTVAPPEPPTRLERYSVAVRRWGKRNRVEDLTREMMEDVRLLAVNRAVQAATEDQAAELLRAIKELSTIEPSLPDQDCVSQYHSGSGHNIRGNNYQGNHNVFSGSGTANFGDIIHQHTTTAYAVDELKKKECLQALFLTDPYEDMKSLKRKKGGRAKGTCEWILGTDQLTAWLDDVAESKTPPTDLLWLHGNPGTGKSTMSMFLVEALSEDFAKTRNKTLAYFFCDSAYDTRKTATAILRRLLLQLVQQHPRLVDYVLPQYETRKSRAFDSFDTLWTMFTKACADRATGRKYCIVDALDECELEEQETLLKQIEETFGQDRSGDGLNFGILITSRPYPEIRECLQQFPNKDLATFEDSRRDIHEFIKEKVAELSKKKSYPSSVAADVTQMLSNGAGGIFLWVGLACQELEKTASKDAVRRLKEIPKGLSSIYEQLLRAALDQEEDPDTIKQLLGFVMVARRPLSTWELASACRLYQDADYTERVQFTIDTIAACRLMVVVQDNKVLLLHQSVRDFLASEAGNIGCSVSEQEAHNRLASRCVDYLTARYSLHGRVAGPQDDFQSYSIQFWPEHAHLAKDSFRIGDDQDNFFAIVSRVRDIWWVDFRSKHRREPSTVSIFHVAAKWGVPLLVDYALSSKIRASRLTAMSETGLLPRTLSSVLFYVCSVITNTGKSGPGVVKECVQEDGGFAHSLDKERDLNATPSPLA